MSYTETAIKKAIEGGYPIGWSDNFGAYMADNKNSKGEITGGHLISNQQVFLDPLFWQSLGKSMGWDKSNRELYTGKYAHKNLGLLCICGHTLGAHSAESTTKSQPCFIQDSIKDIQCDCEKFKKTPFQFAESNPEWKELWYRFIDHLAEGKDAESFFKELLSN